MGKRTARGRTAKQEAALFSERVLKVGLLRGFAAKVGRPDIEEKCNKSLFQLLGGNK
jgi:hypothetical protein